MEKVFKTKRTQMCIRDSVKRAVHGAMKWFDRYKLTGLKCERIVLANGEPVSYTHLDVYKRQGQESTNAVLLYPDFYKAAYSACGCHDNRMDKIWWNERCV